MNLKEFGELYEAYLSNLSIEGMNPGTPAQLSDEIPGTRLVGGVYTNFKFTFQDVVNLFEATENHFIIANVVIQGGSGTISITPQTLYFINSSLPLTFNFPGASGAVVGQPVEIHAILNGQKFINAPAGGYFRNDNAYWTSFNPIYTPSGAAGQFIMKFRYFSSNVWTYEISQPYTGILNGTPLLGDFVAEDGSIDSFVISNEGDLHKNGEVVALKGTFINPEE